MTAKIRNLQIHVVNQPRDVLNKVRLKETIDKRNKWLTRLRVTDYKKFEWLLDKLDIVYRVYGFKGADRVERKKSLRRLVMIYTEKLKSERLSEYRGFLESQQEDFLKEKLEKFISMRKIEEECGIIPTVTEEDIEHVKKQLQTLQASKPKVITE